MRAISREAAVPRQGGPAARWAAYLNCEDYQRIRGGTSPTQVELPRHPVGKIEANRDRSTCRNPVARQRVAPGAIRRNQTLRGKRGHQHQKESLLMCPIRESISAHTRIRSRA